MFPHRCLVVAITLGIVWPLNAQTVLRSWSHYANFLTLVGDLDGDDIDDFVTSQYNVIQFHSTRTGSQFAYHAPAVISGWFSFVSDAGDVNGDGKDDLFAGFSYGNVIEVRVVSAATTTGTVLHIFPRPFHSSAERVARLGDINGDGKAEFLIEDPLVTTGRIDVRDGATGTVLRTHLGFTEVRALGDLDGDDKNDYLIQGGSLVRTVSGLTGQTLFVPARYYGLDVFDLGDVDADGSDDFSCTRPLGLGSSSGSFYVISGSNGAVQWGYSYSIPSTTPVYQRIAGKVGDLDGDGHADLSIWGRDPASQFSTFWTTIASGRDRSILWAQGPMYLSSSPGDLDGDAIPDLWNGPITVNSGNLLRTLEVIAGVAPGVAPIGLGCPDTSGKTPVIGIGVGARLGQTMTINLSNAHPNLSAAILGLGYSGTVWNSVPLPIDLGAWAGLPGCSWYVAADTLRSVPTVGLNGTRRHATYPLPVPAANQLLGVDLFCQWAVFEPVPNGVSAAVSRAMRTRVVP